MYIEGYTPLLYTDCIAVCCNICRFVSPTLARKRASLSLGIIPSGDLAFRPEYLIYS